MFKVEQALNSYGEIGKDGVIEVTLKRAEPETLIDTTKIFYKVERKLNFPVVKLRGQIT